MRPSPDRSLQLDSSKSESLVILDQHARVNAFPGLVHTARHTTKVGFTRRLDHLLLEKTQLALYLQGTGSSLKVSMSGPVAQVVRAHA